MSEYRWAVLGCGAIANQMAQAFAAAGRRFSAVGTRRPEQAAAFAEKYGIAKAYDDFSEMFTDPDIDVIYVATPHNTHIQYLLPALRAGKHVLCEKAITLNSEELALAEEAARSSGAVLAEAQTIYHMPLYRELARMKEEGLFGSVNLITLNFGSFKEYDPENRFFSPKKAGGAMLDIGVYALSCARIFLDENPEDMQTMVEAAPTGVDMKSVTILRNSKNQMVTMALSLHSKQPKRAMISCDKAYIEIMEYPRSRQAVIHWTESGESTVLECGLTEEALIYELQDMEQAIDAKEDPAAAEKLLHVSYTEDVMHLMTEIRRNWGFRYPEEEA